MKSFVADKNRKLSKLALYHVEDLSYSGFMRALRKKDIKVNGKRINEDITLNVGDKVEIYYVPTLLSSYVKRYADDNVVVVYKNSGYTSETVYENLLVEYSNARFIHRLDRNTDGVMIFALNDLAEKELLDGFKNRTFDKKYTAKVLGVVKKDNEILTAYLKKDKESATVTVFSSPVKDSVQIKTGYKVIERAKDYTVLEVTLFTGKTHQIRAHLAFIGHPIIGDGKYGDFSANQKFNQKSQNLTATKLTLYFEQNSLLYYLNGKTFTAN